MTEESHQEHNGFIQNIKNIFSPKQNENVRETIEDLIEDCNEYGDDTLSEHEQLLLNNVLYLKDKKCGHAMIPRAEIIAFHKDGTAGDLAELMVSKGHSRIPIYGESLDDIIGIIHVIDLVKSLHDGKKDTKVSELVRHDVKFVSPSTKVIDLLRDMQSNKVHMAIVIDEYGGVDGLVTIEDLLEEIVGNIEDEYDVEEEPIITVQNDGSILADAAVELDEIKEVSGLDLSTDLDDDSEIDTLGGLIFQITQRIPNKGEIIAGSNGISYKILEVDPRRIKKVIITYPQKQKAAEPHDK